LFGVVQVSTLKEKSQIFIMPFPSVNDGFSGIGTRFRYKNMKKNQGGIDFLIK